MLQIVLAAFNPGQLFPQIRVLIYVTTVFFLILFAAWCVYPEKKLWNKQTKYYFLFVVLAVIGTIFARNPNRAYLVAKSFVFGLMGYLIYVTFLDSPKKIQNAIKLSTILSAILALISIRHGGKVPYLPVLDDANDVALSMNIAAPFAFFLGQGSTHRRSKIFYYSLFGVIIMATVVSFSRGGFLGLITTMSLCWFWSSKKVAGAFLVACVIALMMILAPPGYWEEINTIAGGFINPSSDDTADDRVYSWKIGWKMFLDNPVIGVGPSNYGIWFGDYDPTMKGSRHWGRVAHSLYVDLLSEYGTVGVILFLGIIFQNMKSRAELARLEKEREIILKDSQFSGDEKEEIRRTIRTNYLLGNACVCGMMSYLVTGTFISVLAYGHFWSLTAKMVALSNSTKSRIGYGK
jgi:O-antigen ligase